MVLSKTVLMFSCAATYYDAHIRARMTTKKGKMLAPDDDDYDFAEDETDDPSDFSVDQFLDDDNDAFVQTKAKKWSRKQEQTEHYFDSIEGEDDSGEIYDDADDALTYDDAFLQTALQAHHEFDNFMASRGNGRGTLAHHYRNKREGAPDDDEYDYAEDDTDDPSDFSVDQFLGDDDGSFVQMKGKRGASKDGRHAHRGFLQTPPKVAPHIMLGVSNAEDDNDAQHGQHKQTAWLSYDDEDQDDDEQSFLQVTDDHDDDYADDRLDGGMPSMVAFDDDSE